MKRIIIALSYFKDLTSQSVITALKKRGEKALLLDAGDFPSRISLEAQISSSNEWRGYITYDGNHYALEDIRSILYRRPTHYQVAKELPTQIQKFAENEANKGFGGMLRSLKCFWVSSPDALRAAEYKPRQLQVARELRMNIPRTLLTNNPQAALDFFHACSGDIIIKALHATNVGIDEEYYAAIYTNKVTEESLKYIDQIGITAHLLQERIDKAFEVRAVVVGQRVFATRINSQHSPAAQVDFRAAYSDLTYEVYHLPQEVEHQCCLMVKQMRLQYSAIDLAVTKEGKHIFFENNSAGQYQWLEYYTGLPITEAIVDLLICAGETNA